MNENYLVLNGKRVDLTEEQLRALGIVARKNPFERVDDDTYYYIKVGGEIAGYKDEDDNFDRKLYHVINYFNDEQFAQQVALHQLLYRKLLKFAYDNGYEDVAKWDGVNQHWFLRYSCDTGVVVCTEYYYKGQDVYFSSYEAAKRASHEVVKPFMKEHPEFVW